MSEVDGGPSQSNGPWSLRLDATSDALSRLTEKCIDAAAARDLTASMNKLIGAAILSVALPAILAGCARDKAETGQFQDYSGTIASPNTSPVVDDQLIVTLEQGMNGKVSSANPNLRFVVLTFPLGHVPAVGRHLSLYRRGLKVAEITVTGPQSEDNIVADVVAGEPEVGDEVRVK